MIITSKATLTKENNRNKFALETVKTFGAMFYVDVKRGSLQSDLLLQRESNHPPSSGRAFNFKKC